jgi:YHS domain-containing protein
LEKKGGIMRGLLSLLIYALLFYLMMRFGCGAHMVHGRHGGYAGHEPKPGLGGGPATDPVCGMEVQAGTGYSKMQGGRIYRFCSKQCLGKFEAAPGQYAS